jgi:hypothetical protein
MEVRITAMGATVATVATVPGANATGIRAAAGRTGTFVRSIYGRQATRLSHSRYDMGFEFASGQ